MIMRLRIAPHSQVFSHSAHELHSDQRLMRNTVVTLETSPRNAPSGHRNRQ